MSFIYPKCPKCGEKGNGVELYELPIFLWKCESCGCRSEGCFLSDRKEVSWLEVDFGLLKWIAKTLINY